jgi:nucleoside-diphosphate-sugar epimerase
MRVLIIGGTGFIGKHLTKMFVENGHEVAIFHRKKTFLSTLNVVEIVGDRENIFDFKKQFLSFKPELVVDTIAYTAQDVWGLQLALKDVTNNLVLLSSGDVYRAYDTFHKNLSDINNSPLTEQSELRNRLYPYRPKSVDKYDELLFNYDKIIVEKMVQREMFNTIILRLPAVFGPDDKQQKLGEYIKPMITNQPIIKLNSKKANWIWTRSYVENVAYGIYLAATNKAAQNEAFNLGDINLKEFDLISKLKELSGWNGEIIIDDSIDEPFNYLQNIQMGNSKIKQILNYEAPINDEQALFRTIKNYR